MDRFDALRAFARVVEAGSFTRAAQDLQLAKATVTQQLQQLEAHLRVKLLHRSTRRLKLTPEGAAYYERVLRILADLDEADASLSAAAATPRGRLRVDVPSPLARFILLPALPAFQAHYPEIQLELGVSDRVVQLVSDNVDCVLRGGAVRDPSLVARRVADLPFGLYAAPRYLSLHGTPAHPRELASAAHRCVGYLLSGSGRVAPLQLRHASGERCELPLRHALAIDDGNACLEAGRLGLGVVALPRYMVAPSLATGELLPLLPDWHPPALPLYVAYAASRHLSTRLRVFVDWLVELLAPMNTHPNRDPVP